MVKSLLLLSSLPCFLGSILEGPDDTILSPLVIDAFTILIQLLRDPCVVVKDTVAWTLGRICELLPNTVLGQPYFDSLLVNLIECLDEEPRVAANVCWVRFEIPFFRIFPEIRKF